MLRLEIRLADRGKRLWGVTVLEATPAPFPEMALHKERDVDMETQSLQCDPGSWS